MDRPVSPVRCFESGALQPAWRLKFRRSSYDGRANDLAYSNRQQTGITSDGEQVRCRTRYPDHTSLCARFNCAPIRWPFFGHDGQCNRDISCSFRSSGSSRQFRLFERSPADGKCGAYTTRSILDSAFPNVDESLYNLASRAAWGDYRLTIHVMPGTRTFGRGGFFIHGGTHAGSAGCINLHAGIETFVREIEAATKGAPECYVPLEVQY